jgi:hypothetical protein
MQARARRHCLEAEELSLPFCGRSADWLKAELRNAAIRELNVSKNSFDFAWIDAIEEAGRQDTSRYGDGCASKANLQLLAWIGIVRTAEELPF